jgi:N-dimethylarginine dimethylaminohydrolase
MAVTPPPGPEDILPSTLRGPGWRPRARAHADELGGVWASFRVASAVAPLRAVLLGAPGEELRRIDDPAAWLMLEAPDLATLQAQAAGLAAAYAAEGVEVHWHRPPSSAPPNHIFAADLFFLTPEGAILARMAAEQRAGEERLVAQALAALGVPILLTPRGEATFEGADAAWLDSRTVVLGVGQRTNGAAVTQIRPILASMGVEVRVATLSAGVQHLLGAVNLVDADLAFVRATQLTPSLREAFRGVRLVELPDDDEVLGRRAMNFVTLGPRAVLMPSGCPRTRATLEAHGVRVVEADVSAYVQAGGAMGCATGILRRG